MHKVIAADAQSIAVTRDDPNREIRTCSLDTRGHSGRPAVDAVEPVTIDIIGKAARTTDARNENKILSRDFKIRQGLLGLCQDGVVAAARTPTHLLVRHEVLALEFNHSSTLAV